MGVLAGWVCWVGPARGGKGFLVGWRMQGYICHDRPGAVCCSLELKKPTYYTT